MVKVLTHLKPPRRFSMLCFDVLSFTTLASSVNSKTSKKSVQKTTRRCLVCLCLKGLYTPKNLHAFFFFEELPFTTLASSVNVKTSKKRMQKRRGGFRCVKTLLDTPETAVSFLHAFL